MFRMLRDGESVTSCVPQQDEIVENSEGLLFRARICWGIHFIPDISDLMKAEKTL